MFSGIEFILGVVCSLMGIGVGYLLLMGVFTGIQFISKQRLVKPKDSKTTSALQSVRRASSLQNVGKTLDT